MNMERFAPRTSALPIVSERSVFSSTRIDIAQQVGSDACVLRCLQKEDCLRFRVLRCESGRVLDKN